MPSPRLSTADVNLDLNLVFDHQGHLLDASEFFWSWALRHGLDRAQLESAPFWSWACDEKTSYLRRVQFESFLKSSSKMVSWRFGSGDYGDWELLRIGDRPGFLLLTRPARVRDGILSKDIGAWAQVFFQDFSQPLQLISGRALQMREQIKVLANDPNRLESLALRIEQGAQKLSDQLGALRVTSYAPKVDSVKVTSVFRVFSLLQDELNSDAKNFDRSISIVKPEKDIFLMVRESQIVDLLFFLTDFALSQVLDQSLVLQWLTSESEREIEFSLQLIRKAPSDLLPLESQQNRWNLKAYSTLAEMHRGRLDFSRWIDSGTIGVIFPKR